MADIRRRHVWHYRPGQMVVATTLPDSQRGQREAHGRVREAIEQHLAGRIGGVFASQQTRSDPVMFRAPGRPPLGFLFYDLAEADAHDLVKRVVHETHADDLAAFDGVRRAGLQPICAMPHWLGSAQQDFGDGSPASLPRPTSPPAAGRFRYSYAARARDLNFHRQRESVPVLILDTRPDWARVRRLATRVGGVNAQLPELLEALGETSLPDWQTTMLDQLDNEPLRLAPPPDGRSRAHEVSDHALFVAGLVHDQVPRAAISIRPVLSRYGAGDLHLLLSVLADVIAQKPPEDRLVINMSLGFLPRLEHLARIWYGVADPNDPDFVPDVPMRGLQFDVDWLNRNRAEVDRVRDLLHSGVRRLFEYLLANNCLAVAAAGNDSLRRVESGRPRLGPRIPARYETVLGVAATVHDASRAADYSNIGDELEFGDHIATFGGGITPSDEPDGGVVGLFTAPRFPRSASRNDNGWAEWSGTSFATGIVSGLVSGYWASQSPTARAEDVLAGFHNVARRYASAVRTPSIPLAGKWQPVS